MTVDDSAGCSRRGFLQGAASAWWLLASAGGLAGCQEAPRAEASDTRDWPAYALGYHVFRAPPDFSAPQTTATIGTMELRVLHDQAGTLPDILALQPDIGQIVHHQQAGDWDIFVTQDDNGLVVSSYSLHVVGLMRIGQDVILTQDRTSRQAFPEGNDPAKWAFHTRTSVEAWSGPPSGEGFVYDGMRFRTRDPAWLAAAGTRFSAYATLTAVDDGRRQHSSSRNSYQLTFSLTRRQPGYSDPRQMGRGMDISAFPGAKTINGTLKTDEAEGGFSRADLTVGGESATWFDASLFWFPGDRQLPPETPLVSARLHFINALRPVDQAEALALGLAHSISNQLSSGSREPRDP